MRDGDVTLPGPTGSPMRGIPLTVASLKSRSLSPLEAYNLHFLQACGTRLHPLKVPSGFKLLCL